MVDSPLGGLMSVSCNAVQCTAVDDWGQEVTYRTTAPSQIVSSADVDSVDDGQFVLNPQLMGVSCTSLTMCTAVDYVTCISQLCAPSGQRREVTFNPQAPLPTDAPVTISQTALTSIACGMSGSADQCVAVNVSGQQILGVDDFGTDG